MPTQKGAGRGRRTNVKLVDLFAGIGGFHYGVEEAAKKFGCGVDTLLVAELDDACRATYIDNHPDVQPQRFVTDVMSIDTSGRKRVGADVVTAGFPCQPFSNSGRKLGLKDPRGKFLDKILDVVTSFRARSFILENVPGILTNGGGAYESLFVPDRTVGSSMHRIERRLSELDGYHVTWFELDSSHVGSAQVRKRIFIVGTLVKAGPPFDETMIRRTPPRPFEEFKDDSFDDGLHLTESQLANVLHTMRESPRIRNGMVRVGSAYRCEGGNVGQAYHSHGLMPTLTKVWARFLPIYFPSESEVRNGKVPRLGEADFVPDRRSYGHKGTIRRASVREVMNLQGFPRRFTPHAIQSVAYAQAGNAVNVGAVREISTVLLRNLGFGS